MKRSVFRTVQRVEMLILGFFKLASLFPLCNKLIASICLPSRSHTPGPACRLEGLAPLEGFPYAAFLDKPWLYCLHLLPSLPLPLSFLLSFSSASHHGLLDSWWVCIACSEQQAHERRGVSVEILLSFNRLTSKVKKKIWIW